MTDNNDEKNKLPRGINAPSIQAGPMEAIFGAQRALLDFWAKSVNSYWEVVSGEKSSGGASYDSGKILTEFMMNVLPPPLRERIFAMMQTTPVQKIMRGPEMAAVFERMGNDIEAQRKRIGLSESVLFEKYNHQFLAEDGAGNIVPVSPEEILKLMKGGNEVMDEPQQMPRIIFTSSHARGETKRDITGITHGIRRMVSEATDNKVQFGYCDASGRFGPDIANKTIVLYRCDVRENSWLNAASLLRRMHELDGVKAGAPDAYGQASPGARAIERMMLAAMVVDPQRILEAENKPLQEIFADGSKIVLRTDAARVAQHFMQMGYSKGGNVVSDALRMLVDDLTAKTKEGPLFYVQGDGNLRGIDPFEVRSLMRQITTWAMASLEHELSPEIMRAGARRVAFNSTSDRISEHRNYASKSDDERWCIDGVKRDWGHNPEDALGTQEKPGYAMKDPRIRRRMVELCAPMINKATLAGVTFDVAEPSQLIIETGAGTSDRVFNLREPIIRDAFKKCGFAVSEITHIPHSGEFIVHFRNPLVKDFPTLNRLQDVFISLRKEANSGLVIADEVIKTQIPALAGEKLSGQLTRKAEGAFQVKERL